MKIPMFFVIGIPRSGTTWLASFLSGCNPQWMMVHEAHLGDYVAGRVAAFCPWESEAYVNGPRHERILHYINLKKRDAVGYGEVTPRVHYFAADLQRRYPKARFVHLVRDPRQAVPSLMNFGYYATDAGRIHRRVAPDGGSWKQHRRAAWAWAYGHNRVRQTIPEFVRFEDLVRDFDAMDGLAKTLGITCDRKSWERRRGEKMNASKPQHPAWEDWPPSWKRELRDMCGAEARQYGYLAD